MAPGTPSNQFLNGRAPQPNVQTSGARSANFNRDRDIPWDELFPAEQARIVRLLVDRVDIGEHAADVRLRMDGLAGLVREIQARPESDRQAA